MCSGVGVVGLSPGDLTQWVERVRVFIGWVLLVGHDLSHISVTSHVRRLGNRLYRHVPYKKHPRPKNRLYFNRIAISSARALAMVGSLN